MGYIDGWMIAGMGYMDGWIMAEMGYVDDGWDGIYG